MPASLACVPAHSSAVPSCWLVNIIIKLIVVALIIHSHATSCSLAAAQVMHGLAAAAEQPRKTRSAASLLLLWLLLLAVMLYIMYGRQRGSSS